MPWRSRATRGPSLTKSPFGVDDPAAVELRDGINDAGAAQAYRLLACLAHNPEGGFHGVLVNGAGLYGSIRGPHAAGNIAAFKGRPGRAGARDQEVLTAKGNFTVGPQIDEEAKVRFVPNQAGKDTGGDIAAHIRADIGGNPHRGQRIGRKLQIPGSQALPGEEGRDIGLHPNRSRIHPPQRDGSWWYWRRYTAGECSWQRSPLPLYRFARMGTKVSLTMAS